MDEIEQDSHGFKMKLVLMVDRLVKMSCCKWTVLIQALKDIDLCGHAQSMQSLAHEKGYIKEISAKFCYREFTRKDFVSQNLTQDVINDTIYKTSLKIISNILNMDHNDADILHSISDKGPTLSAKVLTSPCM